MPCGQAHIMAYYEYTRLQKITGMPEKYSKSLALMRPMFNYWIWVLIFYYIIKFHSGLLNPQKNWIKFSNNKFSGLLCTMGPLARPGPTKGHTHVYKNSQYLPVRCKKDDFCKKLLDTTWSVNFLNSLASFSDEWICGAPQ